MAKNTSDDANGEASAATTGGRRADCLLEKAPWLTFVLPFAVFMLLGSLEPRRSSSEETRGRCQIAYKYYPVVYVLKVLVTFGTILLVLPGYKRFSFRLTLLGPLVGLSGIVVWVGICGLDWEQKCLCPLRLDWLLEIGSRSAYDPFRELSDAPPIWALSFLGARFFGLVVVAPIVEEFLLRGFLMPLCVDHDWRKVPFGTVSPGAVLGAVFYGMLTHPAELLAAAVWFAIVTWLMVKTKSIWDCVIAHAVTNALLGVYVVYTGNWQLL